MNLTTCNFFLCVQKRERDEIVCLACCKPLSQLTKSDIFGVPFFKFIDKYGFQLEFSFHGSRFDFECNSNRKPSVCFTMNSIKTMWTIYIVFDSHSLIFDWKWQFSICWNYRESPNPTKYPFCLLRLLLLLSMCDHSKTQSVWIKELETTIESNRLYLLS